MLEIERRNLRKSRAAYAKEIQSRTELEELLRQCVNEAKEELDGKTENKNQSMSVYGL